MRTTKYTLYIEICENVITDLEITKKQYQETIKQMEYNNDHADEVETKPELVEDKFVDYDGCTQHITHYNVGASHIVLTKIECKPGYCFKK